MNRVHDALSERLPLYRKWHEHALSQSLHWALFLGIAILATGNTLGVISAYADEVDGTTDVPVSEEVSSPADDVSSVTGQDDSETAALINGLRARKAADLSLSNIATSSSATTSDATATTTSTSTDVIATSTTATTTDIEATSTDLEATSTSVSNFSDIISNALSSISTTTVEDNAPTSTQIITATSTLSIEATSTPIVATSTDKDDTEAEVIKYSHTVPKIISFIAPISVTEPTVTINSFKAVDDVSVSGYLITESENTPSYSNGGWSYNAITSYVLSKPGMHTLYAWVKDAQNNISQYVAAQVIYVNLVNKDLQNGPLVPRGSSDK